MIGLLFFAGWGGLLLLTFVLVIVFMSRPWYIGERIACTAMTLLIGLGIPFWDYIPAKMYFKEVCMAQSKGDRENAGRQYDCPALSRCCPVAAYTHWLDVSGLVEGPAFRKIDRHGAVQAGALHPGSLAPLLRGRLEKVGLLGNRKEAGFSSHSLRRGLPNWARDSGLDFKALMAYVGWKDMRSALRYLEDDPGRFQDRFEQGLQAQVSVPKNI